MCLLGKPRNLAALPRTTLAGLAHFAHIAISTLLISYNISDRKIAFCYITKNRKSAEMKIEIHPDTFQSHTPHWIPLGNRYPKILINNHLSQHKSVYFRPFVQV